MPQLFQVLRCYKCLVFQIHQTKKSNKWQCKMCGEKQSIKRHYGLGNGKECRLHVQRLNAISGQADEGKFSIVDSDDLESSNDNNKINDLIQIRTESDSKWSTYVEKEEMLQDTNQPMYLKNKEVCFEIPRKGKKNRDSEISNKQTHSVTKETIGDENYIETLKRNQYDDQYIFKDPPTAHKIIKSLKNPPNTLKPCNEIKSKKKDSLLSNKINNDAVVQKTSKWSQFVKTEDEFADSASFGEKNSPWNTQEFFALCDDNDLDRLLSI